MIGEDVSYTLATGQDQTMFQPSHDGFIVRLMRFSEICRHGCFVVEVGEGAVRVRGSCVKDCWRYALMLFRYFFSKTPIKIKTCCF